MYDVTWGMGGPRPYERSLSARLDRVRKAEWCTQCNPSRTHYGVAW